MPSVSLQPSLSMVPTPAPTPSPTRAPTDALVFVNPSYVDADGEAENLRGSLSLEGISYGTTSALSPPDSGALVIPELEIAAITPSAGEISALQAFVTGGGTFLICGDYSGRAASLINTLFGTSLSYYSSSTSGSASITSEGSTSADSPFTEGPGSVPGLNAVYKLSTSSVESSSFVNAYGTSTESWVCYGYYGAGRIVYLGYDWYATSSNSAWNQVLSAGLTGPVPTSMPSVSLQPSLSMVPTPAPTTQDALDGYYGAGRIVYLGYDWYATSSNSAWNQVLSASLTALEFSCDFETSNICGFSTDSAWLRNHSAWLRNSGGTPSEGTGPAAAYSGEYYMFVEASDPNYPSKSFNLTSPTFPTAQSGRVEFAYHLYGSEMGSLELRVSDDGTSWSTLWTKSGNQGDAWFTASVGFSSAIAQVQFRGTTGAYYTSDMAVDALRVQHVAFSREEDDDDGGASETATAIAVGSSLVAVLLICIVACCVMHRSKQQRRDEYVPPTILEAFLETSDQELSGDFIPGVVVTGSGTRAQRGVSPVARVPAAAVAAVPVVVQVSPDATATAPEVLARTTSGIPVARVVMLHGERSQQGSRIREARL
eukprot:CAMPEP_0118998272 /NCGR_PEP_ID=MMETSP1173-20130426/62989_1 /TAXON_ID=1034831 /ORGANISM="Rhizochromulina marina cf, Strain CCMP1243" /LENGTH=597 /DNA_ID=CAMNT_0006949759 /DNA_START=9 /DNA_END=1802 /DNA_ORIENTATION=-